MSRYILTGRARQDLQQIWKYISRDNPEAADRTIANLYKAMEKLAVGPDIGHTRSDVKNSRYRFLTVHPYVIAYSPKTSPLRIGRIFHGARNIRGLLGGST